MESENRRAGVGGFHENTDSSQKNTGGKYFFVYSVKQREKKVIQDKEVMEEIRKEIGKFSRQPDALSQGKCAPL